MTSRRKLIVILIDGLSADYFNDHSSRLPNLATLAARGTSVARLRSAVPATSMPGRTSMITGAPSQVHGVFGNHVFDGRSFRCALPSDVAVPTIARRAKEAGRCVASVGYAMVRPEDADLFQPPWWLRGWMRGSRFAKVSGGAELAGLFTPQGDHGRFSTVSGEAEDSTEEGADRSSKLMRGFACDQQTLRTVAALACSDNPPDLILTEVAMTDQVQHSFGYESQAAHWSLATADLLVGFLLYQIELAGRQDDYSIVVTSDHGHSPIDTAIFPEVVLPETLWESEGATLHVAVRDAVHRRQVERELVALGAEAIDSQHVPEAVREQIATFAAPERHSFEERPAGQMQEGPTGPPAYVSSHGLRPGAPADDRFCVFAGAGVARGVLSSATAEEFCPTLASILDLPDAHEGGGLPGMV